MIDQLANPLNSQLLVFISPFPDPAAFSIDALSVLWDLFRKVYSSPPTALVCDVLMKLQGLDLTDLDSPVVAKSVVVPRHSTAQHRPSRRVTSDADSVDTAGGESSSPPLPTSGARPDCVVSVRCANTEFHLCCSEHLLEEVVFLVPGTWDGSVASHYSLSD